MNRRAAIQRVRCMRVLCSRTTQRHADRLRALIRHCWSTQGSGRLRRALAISCKWPHQMGLSGMERLGTSIPQGAAVLRGCEKRMCFWNPISRSSQMPELGIIISAWKHVRK